MYHYPPKVVVLYIKITLLIKCGFHLCCPAIGWVGSAFSISTKLYAQYKWIVKFCIWEEKVSITESQCRTIISDHRGKQHPHI